MYRFILLSFLVATANSFAPPQGSPCRPSSSSQLDAVSRRDAVMAAAAALLVPMSGANAFSQQLDDYAFEPQQQATDGRLDLNSAFVGDYMSLRGMFPNAAGKIASNGPYVEVDDIYDIPELSDHDIEMFEKYEKYFTVHPPGRTFYERINARVST